MKQKNKELQSNNKFIKHVGITILFLWIVVITASSMGFNPQYLIGGMFGGTSVPESIDNNSSEEEPTPTPSPEINQAVYVDPDPIVSCGPGEHSGQYVKDKSSNCKNYVDCGLNNNTYSMMLKSDCDAKHAAEASSNKSADTYPPCTINYSAMGPITYYTIPPQDCASKQMEASVNSAITDAKIKCIQRGGTNCDQHQ